MKERLRRRSYLLPIVIASGLLLPALTLLPFGTLWLWQKGYLLHWAVGAACLVAIASLVQRRFLRSLAPTDDVAAASEPRQAGNAAIGRSGDLLFSLEDDAELVIARSSRTAFEVLRRYTVADSSTWAQAAISGNRIFVKDGSHVALWTVN